MTDYAVRLQNARSSLVSPQTRVKTFRNWDGRGRGVDVKGADQDQAWQVPCQQREWILDGSADSLDRKMLVSGILQYPYTTVLFLIATPCDLH